MHDVICPRAWLPTQPNILRPRISGDYGTVYICRDEGWLGAEALSTAIRRCGEATTSKQSIFVGCESTRPRPHTVFSICYEKSMWGTKKNSPCGLDPRGGSDAKSRKKSLSLATNKREANISAGATNTVRKRRKSTRRKYFLVA